MSYVNQPLNYSGTGQPQMVSSTPDEVWGLTPEALMTYCQTQIRSIDDKIEAFMKGQKDMMKKKEILQELKTSIETNCTVGKEDGEYDKRAAAIAAAYEKAYNELVEAGFPDLANQVFEQCKTWFPNAKVADGKLDCVTGGHGCPIDTDSSFAAGYQTISDELDALSKDMELNMIQLQSDMSKRQTAIQLTTNMLDKFNRGLDQVVGNIK